MNLSVRIDNETVPLRIEKRGSGFYVVLRDNEYTIDAARPANNTYSLIINGSVYEVQISRSDTKWYVTINDEAFILELEDGSRSAPQTSNQNEPATVKIYAQMPGKVVRVLVAVGDEVNYEQGLLVLEAMKMQNEIKSPRPGRVTEVTVTPGKAVNAGDLLLTIE